MPREKSYMYPTVLVFKTSSRSNAKTKIKVYKTKNVDEVIDGLERDKLPGVPSKAEILHLSIGESFIPKYKQRYKL
jgi:hypothetical protein|tara:strand:+ start:2313 stop:2540 length:228 start_codon:yes stop_codon:yes gene_type:complete